MTNDRESPALPIFSLALGCVLVALALVAASLSARALALQDGTPQSECIISILGTFTPVATPSPPPASPTEGSPVTDTPTPSPSPEPTEVVCTPTPSPIIEEVVDVEEDSDTGPIAGAVTLLVLGMAAAGGGLFVLRRTRAAEPPEAS